VKIEGISRSENDNKSKRRRMAMAGEDEGEKRRVGAKASWRRRSAKS